MERSKRKRSKKNKLLGSHQRSWIWGRNAVTEILEAGKWPIAELYLDEGLPEDIIANAQNLANGLDAKIFIEPAARLVQLCHSSEHQGFLAKMRDFPYTEPDEIFSDIQNKTTPLYAILDSIQDPYNFGAIIRSAEVLGVDAIFIGDRDQVGVTSMVARSSSGAVNRVPIARVTDLCKLAEKLKTIGITVAGASEKAEKNCGDYDFTTPTAIILGNEGTGISPDLLDMCDCLISIEQQGSIGSLNVAAAAAIMFYEANRQRE